MKKLLIGLCALGLVFAFTMPAMATDVQIGGEYYARGWYDDNSALYKDSTSNALYQQRLRISAVFKVARGLTLKTRMDALELTWGENLPASQNPTNSSRLYTKDGYTNEGTDWDVEMSRLDFATKYGLFSVGIWDTNEWGCTFGNNSYTTGSIMWMAPIGKIIALAKLEKNYETDAKTAALANTTSDNDTDAYVLAGIYKAAGLDAGLLYKYVRIAYNRDLAGGAMGYTGTIDVLSPYVKWKKGDFYLEAQIYWLDGEYEPDGGSAFPKTNLEGLTWYLMGKYKIAPAYTIGAMVAYAQGDDPNTSDTVEGASITGGWDWNPCLILWNDDFNYKANGVLGHVASTVANHPAATDGEMRNAYLYQVFFEATPMEKLSILASLTYAEADEKPAANWVDEDYGTEFDISASLKIYDNLDYTIGFAYFWAGDYYKGQSTGNEIDDTYLFVHKITLNF